MSVLNYAEVVIKKDRDPVQILHLNMVVKIALVMKHSPELVIHRNVKVSHFTKVKKNYLFK